jgi:Rrf2 family transcriptional regulator, cysteine metabolism repressor
MLFSTRAEYGIRLMVTLARRGDARPASLASLAEAENLPVAYLEQIVPRLRATGMLSSQRGAQGGYLLARRPEQITMLEVVEALEGPITPMECFEPDGEGRVLCSHPRSAAHSCSTKLLWTRVQGGISRALAGTTLAELVEFERRGQPAPASA